jgi:glutathione-specific gamma-glutamylcyclotransferase
VHVRGPDGPFPAIAFVMNRGHHRYAGRLAEAEVAAVIARAEGALGHCCHYLFSTLKHLHEAGLRDRQLERIAAQVEQLQQAGGASAAAGQGG